MKRIQTETFPTPIENAQISMKRTIPFKCETIKRIYMSLKKLHFGFPTCLVHAKEFVLRPFIRNSFLSTKEVKK